MELENSETTNDSGLPPLEQLTAILSSHHIGVDLQKGELANDLPLLPFELIIDIFSRLPAMPLVRFKRVSHSWYNLINSPDFIKLHLSQSLKANSYGTLILQKRNYLYTLEFSGLHFDATELNYPENINLLQAGKLVGSCNGLLCFTCKYDDQLALYNPVNQAYKMLPRSGNCPLELDPSILFAFDCVSNDYKVLRFTKSGIARITILFGFRTNAWEIIGNPPWAWDSVKFPNVVTASNNSLHWMDCHHKQIWGFNLFTQRYFEMFFPKKISPGYSPTLAVLKGQLSIVTYYFDIWVLKEYGVDESWTRLYRCPSLQWSSLYKSLSNLIDWRFGLSLAWSEDGLKILVALGRQHFICCDLESLEARKIEIPDVQCRFSAILPWVASLTPLSD